MASANSNESDNENPQNIPDESPPPSYDDESEGSPPPLLWVSRDNEEPRASHQDPEGNERRHQIWNPFGPPVRMNDDQMGFFIPHSSLYMQARRAEVRELHALNLPIGAHYVVENGYANVNLGINVPDSSSTTDNSSVADSESIPSLMGSPRGSPINVIEDDSTRPYPTMVSCLPIKPNLPPGSIFYAYVTSAESPFNFTLMPTVFSRDGLCEFITDPAYWDHRIEHQIAEGTRFTYSSNIDVFYHGHNGIDLIREYLPENNSSLLTSMAPVFQLENQLHQYMERGRRYLDYQSRSFDVEDELVAIKDDDCQWHRAVVIAINVLNEDSTGELGMVTVRLIDHGDIQNIPLRNVFRLPQQFAELGCNLYTCSITGIISKRRDAEWPNHSREAFRKYIQYQKVLVFVQKPPAWDEYLGNTTTFESNPYLVRLGVQSINDRVVDASRHMVKIGHALPFNEYSMELYPQTEDGLHHVKYDYIARWIEARNARQFQPGAVFDDPDPPPEGDLLQPSAPEEEEQHGEADVEASQAG